jgi:hypothetical protein
MNWMNGIFPEPPENLFASKSDSANSDIIIKWSSPSQNSADSISYFALYSLPHPTAELLPDYLLDIFPASQNSYKLAIQKPERINYYFALNSVSKLWNESIESSNVVEIKMSQLGYFLSSHSNPILLKESNGEYKILINSNMHEKVELTGLLKNQYEKVLVTELSPGRNVINLDRDLSHFSKLVLKFLQREKEVGLKLLN